MSYTPKFQKVLDTCADMSAHGANDLDIQEFFFPTVYNLGQWERLQNLYRIRPKKPIPGQGSRMQFLKPNAMQTDLYSHKTARDLVLKMRQGGVTTFSCIIALDFSIWEQGFNSTIMAQVKPNVQKYFRITKTAFKQFQTDWGKFYPVNNTTDNVNELAIAQTGSSLMVATETKGLTLDFLHISEAAFVEDARISESIESVPSSGWVILETTPDTASGMFYDLWQTCQKGELCSFTDHFYAWWWQYPEEDEFNKLSTTPDFKYTEKEELLMRENPVITKEHIVWRRLKISEVGGDEGEFCRKYPEDPITCFLSGSHSIFPSDILTALWKNERVPSHVGDLVLADAAQ